MVNFNVAIVYDFDGTLAKGNIQENSFIPKLNIKNTKDFWKEVKALAEEKEMDEILSYMYLLLEKAREAKVEVKQENFKKHGKGVKYFQGVEDFFKRINSYAQTKKIKVLHYIVSSGTKEMIEGTSIAKKFEYIYASSFMYDHNGIAIWPALAINYTIKTQFLYRINKGIRNAWDNSKINMYMPKSEREVPFKNMIYIGDGATDIPAMKLVCSKGGHSIAVYPPKIHGAKDKAIKLLYKNRSSYLMLANYEENKDIDRTVKAIIDNIASNRELAQYKPSLQKKSNNNNNTQYKKEKEALNQNITDEQKYLEILKAEGFSIGLNKNNYICLKEDDWDDYGYKTSFYIWYGDRYFGQVKIARKEQKKEGHTKDLMKIKKFTKLSDDFYSKVVKLKDDVIKQEEEAIKFLLNDISDCKKNFNDDVIKTSLFRD